MEHNMRKQWIIVSLLAMTSSPLPLYAIDGIAVSARWSGSNANLYGGFGKIMRYDIAGSTRSNTQVLYEGNARFATINQTGTHVAFIKENGWIAVVGIDGGAEKDLVKVPSAKGYLDWPDGQWLYYSEGGYNDPESRILKKVNIDAPQNIEPVADFGRAMWLWSISADGLRACVRTSDYDEPCAGNGHVYRCTLPALNWSKPSCNSTDDFGSSCGNALSPSGATVMMFTSTGHNGIKFYSWNDTKNAHTTISGTEMNSWGVDMGGGWNRNRWSCNSENWICTGEGWNGRGTGDGSNQVLYDWVNKEQVVASDNPKGSGWQSEAGDFWVGSVSDDPRIGLSVQSLNFTAETGAQPPPAQSITVTSAGNGTLDPVTATIAYEPENINGWLSIDIQESGSEQRLVNSVNHSAVTQGTWSATVTVSASNAYPPTAQYTVVLSVTGPPLFSSVALSPSVKTLPPGSSVAFSAVALDQNDTPLSPQPSFSWEVTGGGVINSNIFTAGDTEGGPWKVTATAAVEGITHSGEAQISVRSAPSDGLLAYWAFDEAAGTHVTDHSGQGHEATVHGAQWSSNGKSGAALQFNGTDSWVDAGGMDCSGGDGITIAVWIRPESFSTGDARIVSKATGTAEQQHYWMLSTIDNGEVTLRFRLRTGGTTTTLIADDGVLEENVWSHAAAVYDGAEMTLYLNGTAVGSTGKSGSVDINEEVAVNVGRNPDGSKYFDGMIDEVRVYSRALSTDELGALVTLSGPAGETPPLTVISPNGGESFTVGDTMAIQWVVNESKVTKGLTVDITLDGRYWVPVCCANPILNDDPAFYSGTTGTIRWGIPDSMVDPNLKTIYFNSTTCRVRVSSPYQGDRPEDASDAYFTINTTAPVTTKPLVTTAIQPVFRYIPSGQRYVLSVCTASPLDIALLSTDGRCLFRKSVNRRGHISIPLPPFPSGLYLLHTRIDTAEKTRPFFIR
jgi:hypothetical protein